MWASTRRREGRRSRLRGRRSSGDASRAVESGPTGADGLWAGFANCEPLEPRRLLALIVPELNSFPQAGVTLYLDFAGQDAFQWDKDQKAHGAGDEGTPIPAFTRDGDVNNFSFAEQGMITKIWEYVSEKFSPFTINVTTVNPGGLIYGQACAVIIGGSDGDWYQKGAGGVSKRDGFTDDTVSNIAFVFSADVIGKSATNFLHFVSESVAHEAGHMFGLRHESDLVNGAITNEYSAGTANEAPIMGGSSVQYGKRGIWWNGTSSSKDNDGNVSYDGIQDDMAVITRPGNNIYLRAASDQRLTFRESGAMDPVKGLLTTTGGQSRYPFHPVTPKAFFNVDAFSPGGMLSPSVTVLFHGNAGTATYTQTDTRAGVQLTGLVSGEYELVVSSRGGYGEVGQFTVTGQQENLLVSSYDAPSRTVIVSGVQGVDNNVEISDSAEFLNVRDFVNGGAGFKSYPIGDVSAVAVQLAGGNDHVTVFPLRYFLPGPAGTPVDGPTVSVDLGTGNDTLHLEGDTGSRDVFFTYDVDADTIKFLTTPVRLFRLDHVELSGGGLVSTNYRVHDWPDGPDLSILGDASNDVVTIDGGVVDDAGRFIRFVGGGGQDTLTIDDSANLGGLLDGGAEDLHYTPKTFSVSELGIFSNAVGGVREFDYQGVTNINLLLGRGIAGGDGPSVFVDGLPAGTNLNVRGSNNDISTNHFHVGFTDPHGFPELSAPFSSDILGTVSFFGALGANTLLIDDRDYAQPVTYTLSGYSLHSAAGGTVNWDGVSFTTVDVYGRNGGSSLVADGFNSTVPVHAHGGTGGGGVDTFVVDDRHMANVRPTRLDLFADHVTRYFPTDPAFETLTYDGYEAVSVFLNDAETTANVFSVPTLPQGQQVNLVGGNSDDTVNIYPRDAAGNPTLGGRVGVTGGGGLDVLNLSDAAAPAGATWTINNPVGPATQEYTVGTSAPVDAARDVETTILTGGGGADTFNLDAYKSGTALRIDGGPGDDTLNFGNGSLTANVTSISAFAFDGQGGSDLFDLNDTNDLAGAYTRSNGSIGYAATFSGYVIGLTDLNTELMQVFPSRSNPDLRVLSTEAGTTTAFRLGSSVNGALRVGSLVNTLAQVLGAVEFDGGSSGGQVAVNDQADGVGRIVHLTQSTLGAVPGDTLFPAGSFLIFRNVVAGFVAGLTLNLGSGADTVYAQPNATGTVSINAANPAAAPGDVLNLALAAAQNYALRGTAASGSVTSANLKPLSYAGFETGPNIDAVAPAVVAANVNVNGNAASALRPLAAAAAAPTSLDVQFSEDVVLLSGAGSITLTNTTTGQVVPATYLAVVYDPSTHTARFTFPGYPGGVLPDGDYHGAVPAGAVSDTFGNALAADAPFDFSVKRAPPPGRVVGRYVFYGGSTFAAVAGGGPDGAIATDKQALLPGDPVTFASVTSYSRGINGVMLDVSGLPTAVEPSPADFLFEVADLAGATHWSPAPAPASLTLRRGAGVNGSDRVTLTWNDGAIRNTWLRLTALVNPNTALATPDVFTFGSLVGDTGDSDTAFRVNALDLGRVKQALNRASEITGRFDFNRDGRVNALDLGLVKANLNKFLTPVTAAAPAAASPFLSVAPAADLAGEASVRRVWDESQVSLL